MKLLVVTSCTGEKKHKPNHQLMQDDFREPASHKQKEDNLKAYWTAAGEMYTGLQHLRLMEGVQLLRNHFSQQIIDVGIISAGYGYLSENQIIAPYEVTFNSMSNREIIKWSQYLGIHQTLDEQISGYDLVFFLLGNKYLRAIELPLQHAANEQKLVFFAGNMSRKLIPQDPPYYLVEVGKKEAIDFSYGLVGLKGYLFKCLATEMADQGQILMDRICQNPMYIPKIMEKFREK